MCAHSVKFLGLASGKNSSLKRYSRCLVAFVAEELIGSPGVVGRRVDELVVFKRSARISAAQVAAAGGSLDCTACDALSGAGSFQWPLQEISSTARHTFSMVQARHDCVA